MTTARLRSFLGRHGPKVQWRQWRKTTCTSTSFCLDPCHFRKCWKILSGNTSFEVFNAIFLNPSDINTTHATRNPQFLLCELIYGDYEVAWAAGVWHTCFNKDQGPGQDTAPLPPGCWHQVSLGGRHWGGKEEALSWTLLHPGAQAAVPGIGDHAQVPLFWCSFSVLTALR